MTHAVRLPLLCSLFFAAACGTIDDLPSADAGSRKDGGFVLVEDPPLPDGGRPGQDGGSPAQDGGSVDGGAPDAGQPPDGGDPSDGGEPPPGCGDGELGAGEGCDDGNTAPGDGCAPDCTVEPGSGCDGGPCPVECGDGVVAAPETCDDGNGVAGDGCSDACTEEPGFSCTGAPSMCTPTCGDGLRVGTEACDDGNTLPGDGCSAACTVEQGFSCTGEPSACETRCGDGVRAGTEACDDGDAVAADGCDDVCEVETGFSCTGTPRSTCTSVCGDGTIVGTEVCDDRNAAANDGCTACNVDTGFTCSGEPSVCTTVCGDGTVAGAEQCEPLVVSALWPYGCSAECTKLGGMKVTLPGVPAGTTAALTGPGGFAATVVDGLVLDELVPGNYSLDGAGTLQPGSIVGTLLDAPAPLYVTVTGGQQAQVTLAWTARGGTGSLWVGSALTQLLGLPDSTLGSPAASCNVNADCAAGTTCVNGNFCARSATVGGRSHLAITALEDGTLVFGGSDGAMPTAAPRITAYAPSALSSSSPQPSKVLSAGPTQALTMGVRVTWPGAAPTEFSALAAMPGGPVFAAAGDAVVQLPYPVGAGQGYIGLSGMGQVLALAVTADPGTSDSKVLWVAFRAPQSTVVKGYTVGAGGFTEVADLAVSSGVNAQDAFGAQVELAVAPDGLTLWMADGLPGTPNQVRLQQFTLSGVPNATVEATRTLFVSGYAAPTGLAVGDVDATEQVSPLLLADDAGKLLLLPAAGVSQLSNEETFGTVAEWSLSAPSGLCFSPARP